jgi:uncharacterized protein (DUF58 family)
MRSLQGLRLNPRRSFHGRVRGERLTRQKGLSVEFADFRDYTEGDDLRHLDWNVLARLQTPVIRTYRDEQDLAVYLMADTSPSMSFGSPTKLGKATQLALAFGFVALVGGDAAYPCEFPASRNSRVLRGMASYPRLLRWASELEEYQSQKTLSGSIREFSSSGSRPGITLILSDGFDPDLPKELTILGGRGHEILFVQILSAEDQDPDIEGDVRLIDSENGPTIELTATAKMVETYQASLGAHCNAIKDATERFGGRYLKVNSNDDLSKLLSGPLRRQGWLVS